MRAVWIDGGTRDEWYLDLGAVAFRDALAGIGVTDVHFELFDATHGGIGWRYPLSLAYLAQRLSPASLKTRTSFCSYKVKPRPAPTS